MKIYILTCINENSELVFAKAYKELLYAQTDMICSFMDERAEFEQMERLSYEKLNDMDASLGNDSACYLYKITETEL